jgi:hypothetical protein
MCRERRDLDAGSFGVGATMMIAVTAAQARLTCAAPEAPTLMGATKLASFNVAKGEIETLTNRVTLEGDKRWTSRDKEQI